MTKKHFFIIFIFFIFYNSYAATVSIPEAVDNLLIPFTTGGAAPWYGQTDYTYNDGDAARSGAITNAQTSYLEIKVIGPGELNFYWAVSSEAGWDYLLFSIDGQEQNAISGEIPWTLQTYTINSGLHTLRWEYRKDGTDSINYDAGFVDLIVFTGAFPTFTYTQTFTRTITPTRTITNTWTDSPTRTVTRTITETRTLTPTRTITETWTVSDTRTETPTWTITRTITETRTLTPTRTITETWTVSETRIETPTRTVTRTITETRTLTITRTITETWTVSDTRTNSPTRTITRTITETRTLTNTRTFTITPTSTKTLTITKTSTITPTSTITLTRTITRTSTISPTSSIILTRTITPTRIVTGIYTPIPTFSQTPLPDEKELNLRDVILYPQPYNPESADFLRIRYYLTKHCKEVKIKIYTVSFRLIITAIIDSNTYAGQKQTIIPKEITNKLANGIYYLILEAESENEKIRAKPVYLVILR